MEQELDAPKLLTRDRVVTLGALALLVALSWLYLLRAPRHSHETAPVAIATAKSSPRPPVLEEFHPPASEPAADDSEEADVPRFP